MNGHEDLSKLVECLLRFYQFTASFEHGYIFFCLLFLYLYNLFFYRRLVLGALTLIQLLGKTKNAKANQGFLLR